MPRKNIDNLNENTIVIRGARQHNLKNIDLSLPRNKLFVLQELVEVEKAL